MICGSLHPCPESPHSFRHGLGCLEAFSQASPCIGVANSSLWNESPRCGALTFGFNRCWRRSATATSAKKFAMFFMAIPRSTRELGLATESALHVAMLSATRSVRNPGSIGGTWLASLVKFGKRCGHWSASSARRSVAGGAEWRIAPRTRVSILHISIRCPTCTLPMSPSTKRCWTEHEASLLRSGGLCHGSWLRTSAMSRAAWTAINVLRKRFVSFKGATWTPRASLLSCHWWRVCPCAWRKAWTAS